MAILQLRTTFQDGEDKCLLKLLEHPQNGSSQTSAPTLLFGIKMGNEECDLTPQWRRTIDVHIYGWRGLGNAVPPFSFASDLQLRMAK